MPIAVQEVSLIGFAKDLIGVIDSILALNIHSFVSGTALLILKSFVVGETWN